MTVSFFAIIDRSGAANFRRTEGFDQIGADLLGLIYQVAVATRIFL